MERLPDPMYWLGERVPLALLIDLLDPAGPDSARIMREEAPDLAWLTPAHAA